MKEAGNRQADRQALHGGHAYVVVAPAHWSGRAEQPPLLDEASTHFPSKRRKKPRKVKEHCEANPNAHTHEWMKDTQKVPVYKWEAIWDFDIFGDRRREVIGHVDILYRLCAHCGKTQWKRRGRWSHEEPTHLEAYRAFNGRLRTLY